MTFGTGRPRPGPGSSNPATRRGLEVVMSKRIRCSVTVGSAVFIKDNGLCGGLLLPNSTSVAAHSLIATHHACSSAMRLTAPATCWSRRRTPDRVRCRGCRGRKASSPEPPISDRRRAVTAFRAAGLLAQHDPIEDGGPAGRVVRVSLAVRRAGAGVRGRAQQQRHEPVNQQLERALHPRRRVPRTRPTRSHCASSRDRRCLLPRNTRTDSRASCEASGLRAAAVDRDTVLHVGDRHHIHARRRGNQYGRPPHCAAAVRFWSRSSSPSISAARRRRVHR